jgi:hypothetical protein
LRSDVEEGAGSRTVDVSEERIGGKIVLVEDILNRHFGLDPLREERRGEGCAVILHNSSRERRRGS